jgi:hypothetical protein
MRPANAPAIRSPRAGDASFALGCAGLISSAVGMTSWDPVAMAGGDPLAQQPTIGIAILLCAVWAVINALRVDQQGVVNNFAMASAGAAAWPLP